VSGGAMRKLFGNSITMQGGSKHYRRAGRELCICGKRRQIRGRHLQEKTGRQPQGYKRASRDKQSEGFAKQLVGGGAVGGSRPSVGPASDG